MSSTLATATNPLPAVPNEALPMLMAAAAAEPADPLPLSQIDSQEQRLRWIGFAVIASVFGGLGTWAALAPLNSAAIGTGVIAVDSYRKTVQHLEGGIVRSIAVREGDIVTKGQVLLTLEDTQTQGLLDIFKGQYFAALAKESRLLAERDRRTAVRFPPELLAAAQDERANDAMRVQSQAFASRRASVSGELSLHDKRISQLRAKIAGVSSQLSSRQQLTGSYQKELEDYKVLLAEGFADRQRVRELERSLAQTDGQLGALQSEQTASELQISETRLRVLQIQSDLQSEVGKELGQVQTELSDLRAKMKNLEDTAQRTAVRAPDAGTVLDLAVHTIGAVVRPGGKLLDLVPQNEKLVVEAQLSPADIDQVRPGQMAEVRFSAFKQREVPRIDGKLVSVSADRIVEDTAAGKSMYYKARVEIAPEGLAALRRSKLALVPGMPAEVLVQTGERTMLSYLFGPLRDTLAKGMKED